MGSSKSTNLKVSKVGVFTAPSLKKFHQLYFGYLSVLNSAYKVNTQSESDVTAVAQVNLREFRAGHN
jgi:hypothetical protein